VKLSLRPMRSLDDVATAQQRERAAQAQQLREARVAAAKRTAEWVEVDQAHLVRRGPFLVEAESDAVFTIRPGAVFDHGRADAPYSLTQTRLHFVVDADGDVTFLESAAKTWTELISRKIEKQRRHAERQAASRAERQRLVAEARR